MLVVLRLRSVQGDWAQSPGPRAPLQRPVCGPSPPAQVLGLATGGHRKARVFSGPQAPAHAGWPPAGRPPAGPQDRCRHHLRGCSGQRPWPRAGVPGRRSHTLLLRQSCWRCRGSRRTRSGYTGPRRRQSTSGRPSRCRSHGRWAAGTARGTLRGGQEARRSPGPSREAANAARDSGARPSPASASAHIHTTAGALDRLWGQTLLTALGPPAEPACSAPPELEPCRGSGL